MINAYEFIAHDVTFLTVKLQVTGFIKFDAVTFLQALCTYT